MAVSKNILLICGLENTFDLYLALNLKNSEVDFEINDKNGKNNLSEKC